MGIGTFVEGAIDTSLNNYVTTYSHAVIGVLTPIAVTAVTSYVLWTGLPGDARGGTGYGVVSGVEVV